MPNNKKQIKEGVFDAADKFVANFFQGLAKNAADQIIKKAEKAKLPPEHIEYMKKIKADRDKFYKALKEL